MEEKIIEFLKTEERGFSIEEISEHLNITTAEDLTKLIETLHLLEKKAEVYQSRAKKYMLLINSHLKVGKFIGNRKGFGFVEVTGEQDIFIAKPDTNGAIHGDTVVIEVTKKNFKPEGRILSIVNRENKLYVGEFYYAKKKGHIIFDDNKISIEIEIDENKTMNAMDGHKVIVKIGDKIKANTYKGEVVKIIGHKNDPGVDILSVIAKYGFSDKFSDEVMKELDDIPNEIDENDIKNRRDLREEEIFTIDGDDAKDLDDAVSLKILENGNYFLGVHIADVSYYVKENSEIDKEAFNRATSVYLVDRVLPMLPHKLSNGICSLNGGVDRFAVSCTMEINDKGDVVSYDIFPSVINSKLRMTYKKVNDILEKNIVDEAYKPFEQTLRKMKELSDILRENKDKRGYIDFDIPEAKILVDEKGVPTDVVLRERGKGEMLIEDFMIVANETVATHINYLTLPFIYRIHGEPNQEKLNSFLNFTGALGYKITGKLKKSSPKSVQMLLNSLKDKEEFQILSTILLRSMQKAVYSESNIGHFGLGSTCYTHFTSPIRRYPDTTVHRLLRTYIFENKMDNRTIEIMNEKMPFIAEHTSEKEVDAIECEREVDDMKMAEYMEKHIGEKFTGRISGVMNFGIFVELDNLIEGLIKIENLDDDFYIYDEENYRLIGRRNKKQYRLGDKIDVTVLNASKQTKTIDFILTKEIQNGSAK